MKRDQDRAADRNCVLEKGDRKILSSGCFDEPGAELVTHASRVVDRGFDVVIWGNPGERGVIAQRRRLLAFVIGLVVLGEKPGATSTREWRPADTARFIEDSRMGRLYRGRRAGS